MGVNGASQYVLPMKLSMRGLQGGNEVEFWVQVHFLGSALSTQEPSSTMPKSLLLQGDNDFIFCYQSRKRLGNPIALQLDLGMIACLQNCFRSSMLS
jgi:hypothetical protein